VPHVGENTSRLCNSETSEVHFRSFDFLYEINGVNFSASYGKVTYWESLPKRLF